MATIADVSAELKKAEDRWRVGRVGWSAVYHSLQIGAVVLAAITTLGTAREWDLSLTLWFAALTTVTTGLTAVLRPGEKWRANRLSYSDAERIRFYLRKENAQADQALARLQALIARHDTAIVGDVGVEPIPLPD